MHKISCSINQISDQSQTGKLITIPPAKTIIVPAQGDTGANVSATNNMSIIHAYFKYDTLAILLFYIEFVVAVNY